MAVSPSGKSGLGRQLARSLAHALGLAAAAAVAVVVVVAMTTNLRRGTSW